MLRHVDKSINVDALKSEIRVALINRKANACPIAMRLAWHMSGTFDQATGTGGSNGATIRFSPEQDDDANKGLLIIRDMLLPIKQRHPELSYADLYTIAGCVAIEFLGGPAIPFAFGRTDAPNGSTCPVNGLLPDASQGAAHLRKVFGRMGFNDQEIVALSGGHTLGRAHLVRSGFDGPWTRRHLEFSNEYYVNLLQCTWKPVKTLYGQLQYTDEETGELMMLPTDIALLEDASFARHVGRYAANQATFFKEFAAAYGKLLNLGCPNQLKVGAQQTEKRSASDEFREMAMHGSVFGAKRVLDREGSRVNVNGIEESSGRTAFHKAAFWGHVDMIQFLAKVCNPSLINVCDYQGDSALIDAARFGHVEAVRLLLNAGANGSIKNKAGRDAISIAQEHGHEQIVSILRQHLNAAASKL